MYRHSVCNSPWVWKREKRAGQVEIDYERKGFGADTIPIDVWEDNGMTQQILMAVFKTSANIQDASMDVAP